MRARVYPLRLGGLWGSTLWLLGLAGCDPAHPPSAPGVSPSASSASSDIQVLVVNGAKFREALGRHTGKVVLVDFWATWCGPCKKLFPHVVELHRSHAKEGLVVLSVSLDDPQQKDSVLAFLQKSGASFENFVSALGTGTQSAEEFELRGDVPLYKLYDRAGKLRHQFSGEPDGLQLGEPIERMDELVKAVLAEK